ncbi:hypothetical protein AXF42_Ash001858 [Apostasia shenzhenica]|uniref:Uncharacterized protein n=1 Tax=Apostasia shenzhenica TaxID=1088818 RepID=A0A2I0ABE8_9ASPA|nr:hypothetical protein AXF42_Ash001858 [Apostasia shenzhenica]
MGGRARQSGSGKSSLKPRRRRKSEISQDDGSLGDGTLNIVGKDEGNKVESPKLNNSSDSTHAKLNGKSKESSRLSLPSGNSNSGAKRKGRPRGRASRLGSFSDEKAVIVEGNSEGVKDESSGPSNPDSDAPIVEYKTFRSRRKNKGSNKDKINGETDANVSSKRKLRDEGNKKGVKIKRNEEKVSVKSSKTSSRDNDTPIINSKTPRGRKKRVATAEKSAKTDANLSSKRKFREEGNDPGKKDKKLKMK